MSCQCVSIVCLCYGSVCRAKYVSLCCVGVCQFAVSSSQVMEAGKIINSLNIYNLYSECYQGPSGDNKTRVSPAFLHRLMPHLQVLPPSLTATRGHPYVCFIINISASEILYNIMIFSLTH